MREMHVGVARRSFNEDAKVRHTHPYEHTLYSYPLCLRRTLFPKFFLDFSQGFYMFWTMGNLTVWINGIVEIPHMSGETAYAVGPFTLCRLLLTCPRLHFFDPAHRA